MRVSPDELQPVRPRSDSVRHPLARLRRPDTHGSIAPLLQQESDRPGIEVPAELEVGVSGNRVSVIDEAIPAEDLLDPGLRHPKLQLADPDAGINRGPGRGGAGRDDASKCDRGRHLGETTHWDRIMSGPAYAHLHGWLRPRPCAPCACLKTWCSAGRASCRRPRRRSARARP